MVRRRSQKTSYTKMPHRVTLILGEGIGPEIIQVTRSVLEAAGADITWDVFNDTHDFPAILESIRTNGVALKGPLGTPIGTGHRSFNVEFRKELGLFANVRPVQSFEGIATPFPDIDLVVIRENLEDLYAGIEFRQGEKDTEALRALLKEYSFPISEDAGISVKSISRHESERISRFAFTYAKQHGRKKVTAVHKANIMKYTDGLFLEAARRIASDYSDIAFEEVIVDAAAMRLVRNPHAFDVLLCPNLYGDILSDLVAGLVGGLGFAPGANIGEQFALFEPVHGTAPDIAGQDKANPTSALLAGVLLLKHLGEYEIAEKIEKALVRVFKHKKVQTIDFAKNPKKAVGTKEFGIAVMHALKN